MRKLLFIFLLCGSIPTLTFSQGIKFEEGKSLSELRAKAQKENKYLFIDCYATWCGPCKAMDKDVYTAEKIGDQFNAAFVSVKVQMDKTSKDDSYVKSWYPVAEMLQKDYNIQGFPSYLFFSPDGRLVHRGIGYKPVEDMAELASAAVDSTKQYYTLLKKYQTKTMSIPELSSLLQAARNSGDDKPAKEVATRYKKEYLDKLSLEELCTAPNIAFIRDNIYLLSSRDKFFELFFKYPQKVDAIGKGLADRIVPYIIEKEEINDKLWNGDKAVTVNPDWKGIEHAIKDGYGEKYVKLILPQARINFYKRAGNWKEYVRLFEEDLKGRKLIGGGGLGGDPWRLNLAAWDMYLRCDDKQLLNHALNWATRAVEVANQSEEKADDQIYDTKARLLYKLGKVDQAIATQHKAIEYLRTLLATRPDLDQNGADNYIKILDLMKQGKSIKGINE